MEFAKRRKELMRKIDEKGIFILPAAPSVIRNGDYPYPYRQNSDFYYLTGFEEPESVLFLIPKRKEGEFVLLNRPRDPDMEKWDGARAGQKGACEKFGADESFSIHELESKLPGFLAGRTTLYYSLGINRAFDKIMIDAMNKIRGRIRSGIQPPLSIVDVADTLHEMRLIKSETEIECMRKAAAISASAHVRAMKFCKPGKYEYQLEAELLHEFQMKGARSVAYSSIVGAGKNSCILHYQQNNQVIQKKDIVLIDAGCEYDYYASDITRTFPASGKFSAEQKAIYEIVLAAQLAAIKTVHPGALFSDAQKEIVKIITQGLVDLKILKGNVSELIEKEAYFPFYMHKSGHWLGLDVHDVGRYKINEKWRALESGMTLTIEPGIYISSDIPNVDSRWHDIGVRIEDDILVTQKGCEVLSADVPKEISDIETVMK